MPEGKKERKSYGQENDDNRKTPPDKKPQEICIKKG